MKSSFLLLIVATYAGALGAQVVAPEQTSSSPGAVTVTGAVVADGTGNPIPYATVKLQPLGRERFADRAGSFIYYAISPGEYKVQARMVGFIPVDTTIVV